MCPLKITLPIFLQNLLDSICLHFTGIILFVPIALWINFMMKGSVKILVFLVWRMFDLMENIICEFYDHKLCYLETPHFPLSNGASSIWIWQLHTEILINHWIVPSRIPLFYFRPQFDYIVYSPYSDLSACEFICANIIYYSLS